MGEFLCLSLFLETSIVLTEITLNDIARSDALTVSDAFMFDLLDYPRIASA